MTTQKWVAEITEYNLRLEKKNTAAHLQMIKKNPHTLLNKLLTIKIKIKILECIAMNNYQCELFYHFLLLRIKQNLAYL